MIELAGLSKSRVRRHTRATRKQPRVRATPAEAPFDVTASRNRLVFRRCPNVTRGPRSNEHHLRKWDNVERRAEHDARSNDIVTGQPLA